jgi:hypothetical protein
MTTAEIDRAFWQNRLEVGVDQVEARLANAREMALWAGRLGPRRRAVLAEQMGMAVPLERQVLAYQLPNWLGKLAPFVFCDEFARNKLAHAVLEIARHRLSAAEIAACQVNDDGEYEKEALLWRLYRRDPANLELVFHLEKIHRKGFAPMRLREPLPANDQTADALTTELVQEVLDAYEAQTQSGRDSLCAAVLENGGNRLVFIKRELQPAFVSRGRENIYGFEREWIILEVEPDLHRVHISSDSPDVPLEIANALGTRVFGRKVTYDNEAIETDEPQILAFLERLLAEPRVLPMVEFVARNSPLPGAPKLRLASPTSDSLAPAVAAVREKLGDVLATARDVESIKVYCFEKRVRVIFESLGQERPAFVVRYADQCLNNRERRRFERTLRERYTLTVLSTEKRYARR